MKRIGYIYEKICSIENLNKALDKACQCKKEKHFVKKILDDREYYIQQLHDTLISETYSLNENIHKTIRERSSQKQRELTVPKFYPDQIMHWAVCIQLQPIFMKGMYHYNCGSIPGRGGIYGKKYIDKIFKHDPKTKYVLKLDIRKFFPNVANSKLKELLRTKIKDAKALRLIDAIIDNGGEGLPIGYYSSQWFSNFYLEKLDHYIKDNWQLWRLHSRPLDFLGFKFYKDKTVLRKRIFIAMNRRIRRVKKKGYCTVRTARGIAASLGWLKHIPSGKGYYTRLIKPIISKKEISKIISIYDKKVKGGQKPHDNQKQYKPQNRGV